MTGEGGDSGAPPPGAGEPREAVIRVRGLKVGFGDKLVMDGLDLDIYRGEVLGFVGGSGAGKSVLTRTILGLLPKRAGVIEVYGRDVDTLSIAERERVERRWGVLFQQGALFSSLTVHAEHPGADARASRFVAAPARRIGDAENRRSSACRPTPPTSFPPNSRAA